MTIATKSFNVSTGTVTGPQAQATGSLQCRIHPVAIVAILDADCRRPDDAARTIGTLLGYVTDGNVLEVTDAFPVPHQDAEGSGVLMDQDYHRNMVALRAKVSPKESVIGWFSTGAEINESSVIIDSFYRSAESGFQQGQVLQSPLNLLVNTTVAEQNQLPIRAFLHVQTLIAEDLAQFHEIPSEIKISDEQGGKMAMTWLYETLMRTPTEKNNVDIFTKGLTDLETQFKSTLDYISRVRKGEIQGDMQFGRAISRALEEIPDFNNPSGDEQSLAASSVLDSLMVVYLSNLARVQVCLAEKVGNLSASE